MGEWSSEFATSEGRGEGLWHQALGPVLLTLSVMKPPSPLLINFNPLWINTFIKYNTNESLETNEIKDIQNPSLTLLLLDSAAIKLCWVIALKISLHLLSSSVLVSLSVGGEQTIWCLVPAHTLS